MKPVEITPNDFLETLDAQLNELPPARRIEILDETRAHLEAMVAARRADGLDESEAWQSAQKAFGEAETVGRELAREWKRDPRVETVGMPLSRREKTLKFARPLLIALVAYPLLLLMLVWLTKYHLEGWLLLVLVPSVTVFQVWRLRKRRVPFTTSTVFSLILGSTIPLMIALKIQFRTELRGTALETAFNDWFGPIMMVVCALASIWMKREANKTQPWRYLPDYATNPIGAEEEYRLSPLIGLATGTLMGFLGTIWMGMQFFGWQIAGFLCLAQLGFALIYMRVINSKAR